MPETIFRNAYQAANFGIESLSLEIELYEDKTLVRNTMQFKRKAAGELCLQGEEQQLLSIKLNGEPLRAEAYQLTDTELRLSTCPDQFELEICSEIHPENNTALSGLYRSGELFCTQCEAEGFRRITYALDRPDVLTVYRCKITADKAKYPVLLSNGNLIGQGQVENGRHWQLWEDPFPKPSYLFALVAGRLDCIEDSFTTASGREICLRIYAEPGEAGRCYFAMEALKRAMRWDEEEYGREYDLDIFMIVAVRDFNMGAMENKGLNIFNAKYILASPETATDQDFADIESVVAHEYFHNWTGNRVTCRDWFQLSLKEGLTVFRDQEFSRDMNSRDVNRIADVRALRARQFPEDAGALAHPVRPESYQEINNFYTATIYEKGAELIRMQQSLLGKAGFRLGMDLYFKRHDGQAVTIDDFVAAMEAANGVDLSQFKYWYSQAGSPEVWVQTHYENGRLSLHCRQYCRPTAEAAEKKPVPIPIALALYDSHGQQIALDTDRIIFDSQEAHFHFDGLPEKPVVSLLRDFSAPILLHQDLSAQEWLAVLRFETNGYAKWNALQNLLIGHLLERYQHPQRETALDPLWISAFQELSLDQRLDPALRAELLTLPGYEDYLPHIKGIDVARLEGCRDQLALDFAVAVYSEARENYQRLSALIPEADAKKQAALRQLKNSCLQHMMQAAESEHLELCQQQFKQAANMTDQLASFSCLVNAQDQAVAQQAIADFYRQWAQSDLVLDKWFGLQARQKSPGALARVEALLAHPAFSFKNPNKVRALIGSFCHFNPRHFHALDGSGYAFLSRMLLQVDSLNPQVAARLAQPFTTWSVLDSPRQQQMLSEVEQLLQHKLSVDLQELLSKSLAADAE